MYSVLDRRGLTDEKISAKLLQLVDCTKVVGYLHNYRKGESGGLEKCEPDEIISNEFVEVPDHPTQLKAIETVLKVKGHLKDKVAQPTIQVNNVIQYFQSIRQSETDVISRGIDALDVLLGEDKTNGFHEFAGKFSSGGAAIPLPTLLNALVSPRIK
jgi:hypothetical protein